MSDARVHSCGLIQSAHRFIELTPPLRMCPVPHRLRLCSLIYRTEDQFFEEVLTC